MLAQLHTALKNPYEVIDSLYQQQESSNESRSGAGANYGFETVVKDCFEKLFEEASAINQLPLLTSRSTPSSLPKLGSLVRFRAMVQDTGYGSEVYRGNTKDGKLMMYGRDETEVAGDEETSVNDDDYSGLRERQAFYIVSVPGENEWVKKVLDKDGLQPSVASLSLEEGSSASALSNKYPIPNEKHFGCVAKVYGEAANSLKTTDVYNFIGILGETHLTNTFDDLAAESGGAAPTPTLVPALHVILTLPTASPTSVVDSKPDAAAVRKGLLSHLASVLGGDEDAAEWLLLALLARTHTRHPTGLALGSLSLNLAFPASSLPSPSLSASLAQLIADLVPRSTLLPVTIPLLNAPTTQFAPRDVDESLESGALQVSSNTVVLVDTLSIGEGTLVDTGVKNLRHLGTTIAQQKLSYVFPYSSFELETDLNFIVLSEGKAIVPTDCVVYVQPQSTTSTHVHPIDEETLASFRSYLTTFKFSEFAIPETMSEVIQADFVERRSKSVGGEGMSQDDLVFRMTASRMMALSLGQAQLTEEAWKKTGELDDRRKDRVPASSKHVSA